MTPPLDPAGGWLPGRGDYGTEYATELIALIEARNCAQGCNNAGPAAAREDFGPGGTCHWLALISIPERVTGFVHDGRDAPLCTNRADPATANTDPLFEVPT